MEYTHTMNLHKSSPQVVGFVQALGVLAYILLFALTANGLNPWLQQSALFDTPIVAMSFVLTVFVLSALTCGSVVLAYPLVLLFGKKVRRAVEVVVWNAVWLAIFLAGYIIVGLAVG